MLGDLFCYFCNRSQYNRPLVNWRTVHRRTFLFCRHQGNNLQSVQTKLLQNLNPGSNLKSKRFPVLYTQPRSSFLIKAAIYRVSAY